MNFGRGSKNAQKGSLVQNGDSWFALTPPGKLSLPRSVPVPVDLQGNQLRNGNWQELLDTYCHILNHDVAIQTPNPNSVTSIKGSNFVRNCDAYVQNLSNDSAGSSNVRCGQISACNWTETESNSLAFDRQHFISGSNQRLHVSDRYTQAQSNQMSASSGLLLAQQNYTNGSNQRLNSLHSQVGSNWMQPEAEADNLLHANRKCIMGSSSNQRLSESRFLQLPNAEFPVPYQTSYNLCSSPRPLTYAESSIASSFPFAPETPDQGKQVERQTLPLRSNASLEECSSQEKDKQWHLVSSAGGEIDNHTTNPSKIIVDSASAVTSTPLKETNVIHEIEDYGLDLNKTPDQKTPKKRKHRPKVIRESKPKNVPKSATPKTKVSEATSSGKRKYVRKKNLNNVKSPVDVAVNEVRPPTVEPSPKSCRRVLNFDLESSNRGASQNMIDGLQASRHQESKRSFNLNVDADDKDICTVVDSISRTSSCQMEQFRQHKEYSEMNQQIASSISLIGSTDQMTSQHKLLTEQRVPRTQPAQAKDNSVNAIARKLHMSNATLGQRSLNNGYVQVLQQTQSEEISQDVCQAHSISENIYRTRQPSMQIAMNNMANWNENRGFKRPHCHLVEEVHPHTNNLMMSPFLRQGDSSCRDKNSDISIIGTNSLKTNHRLNTRNGLHGNRHSMHSSTSGTIYSSTQIEGAQVKTYANSGSSEVGHRLLNSCFDRVNASKKLNTSVIGASGEWCNAPMKGNQVYQKQQDLTTLHAQRRHMSGQVYQLEVPTNDYQQAMVACNPYMTTSKHIQNQQAMVACNPYMTTSKHIQKAVTSKKESRRAEKMLLQQQNVALEGYQQTPKKARGKLGKKKMSLLIEEITFRLEALLINIKRNEEVEQEQHALVPYNGSSTIVPYEGFDHFKKRKPRPKVDLDPETDRIWKLLMGIEGSEGAEATDKDKEKWWEGERDVFRGRAESFIARMHLVQGDRRFSRWKGSVVDSVIGVFLTQNVSDHLSSSAFMSLAARFPLQSGALVEEPDIQVLESSGSISCHEEIGKQPIHNLPSYIAPDHRINSVLSCMDNVSWNCNGPCNFQASQEKIISNTSSHSITEVQGTDYNSIVNHSPSKTTVAVAAEPTLQKDIYNRVASTQQHEQSEDPVLGRQNHLGGPAICPHETNSYIRHRPVLSSREIQLNMIHESIVNQSCNVGLPRDECLPCFPTTHTVITKTDGANLVKRGMRDMVDGKAPALQNGVPNVQANQASFTYQGVLPTHVASAQPENSAHSIYNNDLENSQNFHSKLTIVTEPGTPARKETDRIIGQKTQKLSDDKFEANANMVSSSSVMSVSRTTTKVSTARKGKGEAGKKKNIDWDNLRKKAQTSGKKERSKETMDSMDYEAMRRADVSEISDAIRERGMNNMLADRIKDFLNRVVEDHGSIDLEWLRDVPPDQAKDYLLSFRGLGLKSVECVRLLTLHQLAFPVDTNVGRIAVRMGWVPLQPLPESLQLHLLELYPILESIQKYLWPRLCNLPQETLYELHYQMITFGKVFCTKSKPNCNACPMRGECRHFASAFASARLALPGPEEKSIVTSAVPITTESNPLSTAKPVQLLQGVQGQNNDAGFITKMYEPIIEEPSTPEEEIIELVESDIEDQFGEDPDEIPTIKLNIEEFTTNLQNYMQEGDMSRALVTLNPEAASIPVPPLKNVSRLRTEHQVYELPDSHPLLERFDKREPDDPSPYLLAIWKPGETADSVQPPEKRCKTHESGQLCDDNTCFSCNGTREAKSQIVRGTILIPCRTAMRGSFPLNGTYFQVNEMFADHESSLTPIEVPRSMIWNLPRRTVYFGTSVTSIFRGLTTQGIQYCFWRGFVCVRGFDHIQRAPRPLMARLHFPASRLVKPKK